MSFRIEDEKLLKKYEVIWNTVEGLKHRIKCFTNLWWQIHKNQKKNIGR